MALTITSLTGNSNNADQTDYVTASCAFVAGRYYLIGLCSNHGATPTTVTSVQTTGGALVFTQVQVVSQSASNNARMEIYRAVPTSNVTATVTIAGTFTAMAWEILEITGAKLSGTNGADAITQAPGNFPSGLVTSDSTTMPFDLTPGSAVVVVAACSANQTQTLSGGTGTWTHATSRNHNLPNQGFRAAWTLDPAVTDLTYTNTAASARLGIIAAEVKAVGGDYVGAIPI